MHSMNEMNTFFIEYKNIVSISAKSKHQTDRKKPMLLTDMLRKYKIMQQCSLLPHFGISCDLYTTNYKVRSS